MNMSNQHSKYALITGASSGIGLELATVAAGKSNNLIVISRDEKRLNQLKDELEAAHGIRVIVFACDLSQPDAVSKIEALLSAEKIVPDILINNAGFGLFGAFAHASGQRETEMIQVNIMALTQLTKTVYPQMIQRGSGKILNVASMAGFMPGPLMAVYYATKAYVLSFSQALANEAKGTGITVTTLCPGATQSNFEKTAALESSMLFKRFGKLPAAAEVAAFGFRKMEQGATLAVHGWSNRAMLFSLRLFPRKTVTAVVRYIQRTKR